MEGGKVALVTLIALVLTGLIVDVRSQSPDKCMDAETRDKARAVMLEGIDLAFKNHTEHVFDIWMKDASDQPKRASAGMRQGTNAYVGSRVAVLNWNPPICKGDKQ